MGRSESNDQLLTQLHANMTANMFDAIGDARATRQTTHAHCTIVLVCGAKRVLRFAVVFGAGARCGMPARLDQRSTRQRRQDVCGLLQPLFGHPGLHTLFARNRHRVVLRQQRVLTCGFILRGAGRLRGRKLHTPFFGDTEPDAAADSQPDATTVARP